MSTTNAPRDLDCPYCGELFETEIRDTRTGSVHEGFACENFACDAHWTASGECDRPSKMILDHAFVGVAGHPDDDECTFRSDGTDATYCGGPGYKHRVGPQ